MKKSEAIELFDGNITKMGRCLGVSRYTIHRWPDELPQKTIDHIRGALLRIAEEHDEKFIHHFGRLG